MSNQIILALAAMMVGMFGAIGGFFTIYFLLKKELIGELRHHLEMIREELSPIKDQVFNHIPTQIRELEDKFNTQIKGLDEKFTAQIKGLDENFNNQIKEIMKLLMEYIAKK